MNPLFRVVLSIRFFLKVFCFLYLKDSWIDLSEDNPYSQFLILVIAGVSQLERGLIRMRQREGIELAKKEGKSKGRLK